MAPSAAHIDKQWLPLDSVIIILMIIIIINNDN